jgi:hypothetical protein
MQNNVEKQNLEKESGQLKHMIELRVENRGLKELLAQYEEKNNYENFSEYEKFCIEIKKSMYQTEKLVDEFISSVRQRFNRKL